MQKGALLEFLRGAIMHQKIIEKLGSLQLQETNKNALWLILEFIIQLQDDLLQECNSRKYSDHILKEKDGYIRQYGDWIRKAEKELGYGNVA